MKDPVPSCTAGDHPHHAPAGKKLRPQALARAAGLFRAMGDEARLRLLELLIQGEWCVTELVEAVGERNPSTVSQRLKILHQEGLVTRRRKASHVFYALADRHVVDLIQNALAHADELEGGTEPSAQDEERSTFMSHHANHDHQHGPACGHTGVKHADHVDYLHDGHLHHMASGAVEEHTLEVSAANPSACTPAHTCGGHGAGHVHGAGCGHEAVPHGDHVDYLVDGHLHHPHGDHCDDHGKVDVVKS